MSGFTTKLKGFTPIIDSVAQDVGLIQAAVYGIVWRHCEMDDHICRASVGRMADLLGVSENTVRRHLNALVEAGYIIDTTPDRRNAPHVYKDARKAKIEGEIKAIEAATQKEQPHQEVTHREQPHQEVTHREQPVTHREQPVTHREQARLPIEGNEDTRQDTSKETTKDNKYDGRSWFVALAELCAINLKLATTTQKRQLGQSAKLLKKSGVTPEQIDAFGEWWYTEDWRGKQGNPPRPAQVREVWGQFERSGYYQTAEGPVLAPVALEEL